MHKLDLIGQLLVVCGILLGLQLNNMDVHMSNLLLSSHGILAPVRVEGATQDSLTIHGCYDVEIINLQALYLGKTRKIRLFRSQGRDCNADACQGLDGR